MSTWAAYGNAGSQQHFLLLSPTGKPWHCAQSRLVCRGVSGWCRERVGIAQRSRSRIRSSKSRSSAQQITKPGQAGGAGGRFLSLEENGMEKGWGRPWWGASHPGEDKRTAAPPCHPGLYGTCGGIQCQPWGQCGMRGPCWHHSPPKHGLALSCSLAKSAHGGQHCPSSHSVLTPGCCIPSLTPAGCTHPGWRWKWGVSGLCAHLAPSNPNFWEAFCACHLPQESQEHLC